MPPVSTAWLKARLANCVPSLQLFVDALIPIRPTGRRG
jgi:hypothetical protein